MWIYLPSPHNEYMKTKVTKRPYSNLKRTHSIHSLEMTPTDSLRQRPRAVLTWIQGWLGDWISLPDLTFAPSLLPFIVSGQVRVSHYACTNIDRSHSAVGKLQSGLFLQSSQPQHISKNIHVKGKAFARTHRDL